MVTEAGVYPFAATVGCVSYNNLSMPLIKWQGIMMFLTCNVFTSVKYYIFKRSSVVVLWCICLVGLHFILCFFDVLDISFAYPAYAENVHEV